ncbi:MAG: glutamate-5-semialdehyde dehydrogenase, partial [bacterium]|nr:glutamate-5-semialdehyde dehydrogenase [bacterium]
LLQCQSEIDLVIPRGSSQLVTSIQNSTRIPVLGHAEGICHLFLDAAADLDMAIRVAIDSKCDYPSACNSIETLLVHHEFLPSLPPVLDALRTEGVELRVDSVIAQSSPNDRRAQESDWSREYSDLVLSVRTVGSLDEAINHIHRYGSGHTEAIVTADEKAASAFLQRTDSASVFVNASTRFADGYRYGLGAEVGISTGRIHARGPVGIDALLTTRWLLSGRGQITADYSSGKRQFRHSELSCAGRKPSINPASIQ